MTSEDRLRRITHIVALLGMLCLAFAERSLVYLLLISVVAVVAWVREKQHRGESLSRSIVYAAVSAAVIWAVIDYLLIGSGWILSLAHFLLITQMVKLLLPKRDRDYAQIYVISLMNVAVAAIVAANLAFAVAFVLYTGFIILALILYHFHLEMKRSSKIYLPGISETVRPQTSPDISGVVTRRFTWVLVGVILVAWVFNAVFFVFSPRVQAGFIRLTPGGFLTRLTGFSDRIRLGVIGSILQNDDPVMHVRLWDSDGNPIGGGYDLYFRGRTYAYYDGEHWEHMGPNISIMANVHPARVPFREDILSNPLVRDLHWVRQEITLDPIGTRTLFALPGILRLDSNAIRQVQVDRLDMTLRTTFLPRRPLTYTVWSYDPPDRRLYTPFPIARRRPSDRDVNSCYTLLPQAVGDAVRRKASEIVGDPGGRSNLEIARQVESYLQTNYDYTLDLTATPGVEPVEDFLLNTREGHCEYFASSMVVLLRSVAVPSRLVSGFHGGEWNEVGGWYIVKQAHAHTWVEVWVPGKGWVRFDPTPGDSRDRLAGRSSLGFVGRWLDYLRIKWVNHVVQFDEEQQSEIVQGTRQATHRMRRAMSTVIGSFLGLLRATLAVLTDVQRLTTPEGILTVVATLLVSTGIVLLMRWLILKSIRRTREVLALRHARRHGHVHVAFYLELERVLKRRGYVRSESSTPREFAETVAAKIDEVAEALTELTDTFYNIRFGGARLSPPDERRLRTVIESVKLAPLSRTP